MNPGLTQDYPVFKVLGWTRDFSVKEGTSYVLVLVRTILCAGDDGLYNKALVPKTTSS